MEIEKLECTRTKSSSSVPLDVTIEILSRLPGKSVVRFRCVSKLWSSITTTPHFIKAFGDHSLSRPSLLLVERKEDKRVFCSLPHRQDPQRRYTPAEKYEMMLPMKNPELFHGKVCRSIRGLIYFEEEDEVVIWNPTLRQHVVLPDPDLPRPLKSFVGYDPIGDKYKVVCMTVSRMSAYREDKARILTLGKDKSWRIAEHDVSRDCLSLDDDWSVCGGICLNGILYYFRGDYDTLECFNVRSEEFKEIRKPKHVTRYETSLGTNVLTSYHGKLAWLSVTTGRRWVLTDPEKQEWSQGWFFLPDSSLATEARMGSGPCYSNRIQFGGVTDSEEIISMEGLRTRPFYAFYGDWKKKTTRWVAYEALTDCSFHCDRFPKHVESLMSLANLFV
ncbi:unnamed protein product [Microthlaspi erraticum]|uniref:F-box domain-containing protein n=1 Tax=Microthlaspi erraticum TaxID=1685480 RepID=A0A6D2KH67_9BRAS|nr:unnamed protein product [Microthlaspi erraticum]